MSALKINNLYRYFGDLQAVNGVTFEVPHGSVCGFVGANGAGKTTTMRILATLDYPTLGSAEVCGINVVHKSQEDRPYVEIITRGQTLCGNNTGQMSSIM
jgi:ABC-2 type transport system ATP-binding protein